MQILKKLTGPLRHRLDRLRKRRLYEGADYLQAYRTDTDLRVQDDPHSAIGGMWEEIGQLQFDFLVRHGMRPHHTMLDVGCGTLRGGRHFIRYLEPGGYTGMDISEGAIAFAQKLVDEEGLADRRPELVVSRRMDLQFTEFAGRTFDFLLAQSVFTHLKPEHIEECFAHVGGVMHGESAFFFTFAEADRFVERTEKDFSYPFDFFVRTAERHGLAVERMEDYPHPRQQRMVRLTRRAAASA